MRRAYTTVDDFAIVALPSETLGRSRDPHTTKTEHPDARPAVGPKQPRVFLTFQSTALSSKMIVIKAGQISHARRHWPRLWVSVGNLAAGSGPVKWQAIESCNSDSADRSAVRHWGAAVRPFENMEVEERGGYDAAIHVDPANTGHARPHRLFIGSVRVPIHACVVPPSLPAHHTRSRRCGAGTSARPPRDRGDALGTGGAPSRSTNAPALHP